jgi:hypothetical protein
MGIPPVAGSSGHSILYKTREIRAAHKTKPGWKTKLENSSSVSRLPWDGVNGEI